MDYPSDSPLYKQRRITRDEAKYIWSPHGQGCMLQLRLPRERTHAFFGRIALDVQRGRKTRLPVFQPLTEYQSVDRMRQPDEIASLAAFMDSEEVFFISGPAHYVESVAVLLC